MKVEFFKHNIGPDEIRDLRKVLDGVFLTLGETVYQFERDLAGYLGCKDAVGVSSCTAALHLSLLAVGVGKGDEVITTPLSFTATANAILHAGAKPVFVDVERETGNLDARRVEKAITRKTKAILPVHLYGHLCDMKKLSAVARKRGLALVEDCAHCLEGERDGVRPAQVSDAACFSFYATKNITSGEGGAVATNSKELADRVRVLRLHGMTKSAADRYTAKSPHWDQEELGFKSNMDNIQASLLLGQLKKVEGYLKRREQICRTYEDAFASSDGVGYPKVLSGTKSARHLFTLWVDPKRRDEIVVTLREKGIGCTINYRPIHLLRYYRKRFGFKPGAFPNAEWIGDRTLTLPLYPKLTPREITHVVRTVQEVVGNGSAPARAC